MPALTRTQSNARFRRLKAAGCHPKRVRLASGDTVVLKNKKCPVRDLAENPVEFYAEMAFIPFRHGDKSYSLGVTKDGRWNITTPIGTKEYFVARGTIQYRALAYARITEVGEHLRVGKGVITAAEKALTKSGIWAYSGPSSKWGSKQLSENPRRPPKRWWKSCVKGVRDSGSAADPSSVCGALWYRKMSPAKRRAALRKEGKMNTNPRPWGAPTNTWTPQRAKARELGYNPLPWGVPANAWTPQRARAATIENPTMIPTIGWVVLLAGLGVLAWWLYKPEKKPAEATGPLPPPPPPLTEQASSTACPATQALLEWYASSKNLAIIWLPNTVDPAQVVGIPNVLARLTTLIAQGNVPIVVLSDGSFYTFSGVPPMPAPAPAQKDAYCTWVAAQQKAA